MAIDAHGMQSYSSRHPRGSYVGGYQLDLGNTCTQWSNGVQPTGFDFSQRRDQLFVSEYRNTATNGAAVTAYRISKDGDLSVLDGSEPTHQTGVGRVVVTNDDRYTEWNRSGFHTATARHFTPSTPRLGAGFTKGDALCNTERSLARELSFYFPHPDLPRQVASLSFSQREKG
jgi:hypothetical protein